MNIEYLGHSSFKIRAKDASIITDPFDSKSVGIKFTRLKADIVTVSHDHDDHNNYEAVRDYRKVVDGPGEYEIQGVSIIGISTYHDDKKGKERGKNTIYVIEADNLRIVHLGDLGHKLTEKDLQQIGDVDILMVPVGGVYTIDHKTAAELVQSIEPRLIIPMHYQVKGLNKDVFGELTGVDEFVNETGLPSEKTDKLKVSSGSIEEEQKVIVLERR